MPSSSSVIGVVATLLAAGLAGAAAAHVPGLPPAAEPAGPRATPRARSPVAPAAGGAAFAGPAEGVADPVARAAARFGWPLRPVPRVVHQFAVGPYPWSPGHRGVDLSGAAGQAVLAAGAGIVTFAGQVAGRGVVVVAHAGDVRTTYEPVTPAVGVGRAVAAGELVGTLESRGSHCPGACLHWGARRGLAYLDPLTLLGRTTLPVLLPDVGVS
ncbi:MAG TPA: M23 family metallopeptidase [Kineosporiaceae bacterium]|nr:M23 family metallopeptidase [Kineosporiaceae bacterium]